MENTKSTSFCTAPIGDMQLIEFVCTIDDTELPVPLYYDVWITGSGSHDRYYNPMNGKVIPTSKIERFVASGQMHRVNAVHLQECLSH